jgi:hydrogenase maturation protein HypF
LGRDSEIVPRLTSAVGEQLAAGVAMLLDRGLHCSSTTSAGRWFDAMAGLLALSVRQQEEAEAAKSLEQYAVAWLTTQEAPAFDPQGLDLRPLVQACLALADRGATGAAAALFHVGLADGLAQAAIDAAAATGSAYVVLGGGCFHNRLLSYRVVARLNEARLDVQQPRGPGPGDTGLALGQAWVAAHQFVASPGHNTTERFACV